MTSIKPLLENDFVAHHGIHSMPVADVISSESKQFDLDDMPSPIQMMEHGRGKVSLTNHTGWHEQSSNNSRFTVKAVLHFKV